MLSNHRGRNGSRADHGEFLAAVEPHLEAIHNIARGLVRDTQHAEDLFQDTCLRAYAGFDRWRGGDIRSWMVAILMNGLRSDLRRAQARPLETFGDAPEAVYRDSIVEDAALRTVEREEIVAALAELPDVIRLCVVLTDIGGLTAQEVADLLSCPRGTVLARVHRARRTIAHRLEAKVTAHD